MGANNKKLTIDYVSQEIVKEGYTLLSNTYINANTKMTVRCNKGHEYLTSWNNFKNGNRCPECAGVRKYTIDEVRNFLLTFEYELLSKEYKNNRQLIEIKCPNGHEIKMSFANFKNKESRCPKCIKRNKTLEEVKVEFLNVGYNVISTEYLNSQSKLETICPEGHVYLVTYDTFFNQKSRCGHCCTNNKKKTHEEVFNIISNCGYFLLSKSYNNAHEELEMKCPKDHKFHLSYNEFQQGVRCKVCQVENQSGENAWNWKGGISTLNYYLRDKIKEWIKDSVKLCNYKCVITGEKFDHLHHIYSFNLIVKEVLEITSLSLKQQFGDYNEYELTLLRNTCLDLHYKYPFGVCLKKELHDEFHNIYGKGENTPNQFYEFYRMKTGKEYMQEIYDNAI